MNGTVLILLLAETPTLLMRMVSWAVLELVTNSIATSRTNAEHRQGIGVLSLPR